MQDEFWQRYEELSQMGRCDAPGGAEYKRVRAEWEACGRPQMVDFFVDTRAGAWKPMSGALVTFIRALGEVPPDVAKIVRLARALDDCEV